MHAAQYASYVSDRLDYVRQQVRKRSLDISVHTLTQIAERNDGETYHVVALLRYSAPANDTNEIAINEYYGKHGEMPPLDLSGTLLRDGGWWSLEDDTGAIQIQNSEDAVTAHGGMVVVADGVCVLARVSAQMDSNGENTAVPTLFVHGLTWMHALYPRGGSSSSSSSSSNGDSSVHVQSHPTGACTFKDGDGGGVCVVIRGGGTVTRIPNDTSGAMIPIAPLRGGGGGDHQEQCVPNPSMFSVCQQRWMAIPTSVLRAWRQWMTQTKLGGGGASLGAIVRAIIMHRHVVPMAPHYFAVPLIDRDPFFIEHLPHVVVAVDDTVSVSRCERVVVKTVPRAAHNNVIVYAISMPSSAKEANFAFAE